MYQEKSEQISEVISTYFEGLFTGNVEKLRESFHPDTILYGDINGNEYQKPLEEYLQGVQNRKSPAELGEANRMETVSLEILGNTAMAKLHVPMLGFNYYDFLSLAIVEGKWKIVNKVFTHVE
ncbi:nuclear transport factor 2 family protein [Flexithrix dorotheae]|uniref:nuclear transport factor 2 family protein n=1 Tax=Flexithrix dorotheae TaxID=70993 RepID=UPI0003A8EBE3|nr:nuclear transport factor 2 family protein [Flexithrix dorotheae]